MQTSIVSPGRELLSIINNSLDHADEIVVLAALVTDSGIEQILPFLLKARRRRAKITFIFGTGMATPSSPDAIEKLFPCHDDTFFRLLYYHGEAFFHPKLMLFRTKSKWSVLLGSSNMTDGGLQDNIEFNSYTSDLACNDRPIQFLQKALKSILIDSSPVSRMWIEEFRKRCDRLKRQSMILNNQAKKAQRELNKKASVEMTRWQNMVSAARDFRRSTAYQERLNWTHECIKKCRSAIGPASHPNIDVEKWIARNDMGYFTNIDNRNYSKTKPTTARKLARLTRTIKHLLDKRIPLEDRLRDVVLPHGMYHLDGMGISLASDILNKYYPADCIVMNTPIVEALNHYGIRHFPSDNIQRYIAAQSILTKLRDEAGYPRAEGFALLDSFLWRKGHKLIYGWA